MTDVSRSTLGRELPKYIRDVIKLNVPDLESRVYKSATDDVQRSLPTCYLDISSKGREKLSFDGTKYRTLPVYINAEVWASTNISRDSIMDLIEETLGDNSSSDGSDTMKSKYIALKRITSAVNDRYIEGFDKMIRIGTMTIVLSYYGT